MENKIRFFTNNNETVVLFTGKDIPKKEIIKRLYEMQINNVDPYKNKEDLENMYDIALQNNYNKMLIFNKLRQDTEYYYRKNQINLRKYIDGKAHHTTNTKIMFNQNEPLIDKQNKNTQGNDTQNSSNSPSILRKILSYIDNNKMNILKYVLFLYLVFGFEASLENVSRNSFLIREILKGIRSSITPRELILGFIFYIILNYIMGIYYFILRALVFAFMILIYRS